MTSLSSSHAAEISGNFFFSFLFWNYFGLKLTNCVFMGFNFEDEPGKQVKSAIRLKNTSRSHVAFKVFFNS